MMRKHRRESAAPGAALETLAPFDPESRETLEWKQPKAWTAKHELMWRDRAVARVTVQGFWANKRTIEFAHARWDVRETGFGDLVVDGPDGRQGTPYLRHRSGFLSGKLERAGLPTLRTHAGGFWNPWWELRDGEDQPLVHLDVRQGFSRTEATLVLFDAARRLPDLPALIGLSMHALLDSQKHHASAAGA
ncbi:MAG: hypothetical protein HZA61_02965 [Candidatus Eisenbacteria bacterium]|uniref:Uncharacterized protein n=1 Tax=Eiseniibacteriota bacterium TaxID=2212470 RepID=A0A933SAA1_UNCEI|nr:hypothetical protein [Candidatus Eisenbacteria bacterium]